MAQTPLFAKLWERKVPQFLGTYLAVGFGVLQFLEFITKRYDLGGGWVDAYLLLWLGLLPAVALLLYYHGLPPRGTGKIASWKRWVVYGNIAVLLPLLWLLLGEKESAKTQIVETLNEAGQTVQHIVPTSSAVQRLAIFELQNEEGEEAMDWWGSAYGALLSTSLMQRPEISVISPRGLNMYYDRIGAEKYTHINVATQRKIAQRARQDYFLDAAYKVEEGRHEINGTLHKTKDGKPVATLQAVAPDPYLAVDIIKDQIFDYLPDPVVEDGNQMALPASALITDNLEALEAYTKGAIYFDRNPGDLGPSLAHYKTSLAKDPTCAACAYGVGDKLYGQGKKDSAEVMLKQAVRLANVLPERFQFDYKKVMFSVQGEYQSLIRLMEMRNKLYPFEYEPYSMLSSYYQTSIGIDTAIAIMEQAATNSNRERALVGLFGLHKENSDFVAAEEVLKDLEKEYPDPENHRRRYVQLYQASGEIDKARNALKDMIILDPLNANLTYDLVKLELAAGYYDEAETLGRKALAQAATYTDSTNMWNGVVRAMASQGRITDALAELDKYEDHLKKVMPINRIVLNDLQTRTDYLVTVGRFEELEAEFDKAVEYDSQMANLYRCYLPFQAVVHYQRIENEEQILAGCQDEFAQMGEGVLEIAELSKHIIAEDFQAAATLLEGQLSNKREIVPKRMQANIFHRQGNTDRAMEIIAEVLSIAPNNPLILLEQALVYQTLGEEDEAKSVVQRILDFYAEADADYVYRKRAEALAVELGLVIN